MAFCAPIIQTKSENRPHSSNKSINNPNASQQTQKVGTPLFLRNENAKIGEKLEQQPKPFDQSLQMVRHNGSQLPNSTKQQFETSFGTNLSSVRIHNSKQHHVLARALNARAFTVGTDIMFGEDHYAPNSKAGKKLLAHEITHVIQQESGRASGKTITPGLQLSTPGDQFEKEADQRAEQFSNSGATDPIQGHQDLQQLNSSRSDVLIQRDEDEDEQGFDYNLLPPSLKYQYGPYSLSADPSSAQFGYRSGDDALSLGYQYGSDIFYNAQSGGFNSRFGLNPETGVGSYGIGGASRGFNFGLSANTAGSFGANFGYGAPLLPMPAMLGQQAYAGVQGAHGVLGAIPDFANDPLGTYDAQGNNINAATALGGSLAQIYGQQQQGNGGMPFGVGARLSYSPEQQWMFGLGVQGSF